MRHQDIKLKDIKTACQAATLLDRMECYPKNYKDPTAFMRGEATEYTRAAELKNRRLWHHWQRLSYKDSLADNPIECVLSAGPDMRYHKGTVTLDEDELNELIKAAIEVGEDLVRLKIKK